MPFKFLEDVTRADVAFEATGKNLSELFTSAGTAVIEAMADSKTVKPHLTFVFKKKEGSVKELLFEFLEEIVFLKDKHAVVFHEVKAVVDEKKLEVKAELRGDTVKHGEHVLHQDVKAVTMHYYTVEKNKVWKTQVVLDI